MFEFQPEVHVVIVRMGADVDDAVHVQVEVVELRNLMFLDYLAEAGVPLRKPAVELGNSHRKNLKTSLSV